MDSLLPIAFVALFFAGLALLFGVAFAKVTAEQRGVPVHKPFVRRPDVNRVADVVFVQAKRDLNPWDWGQVVLPRMGWIATIGRDNATELQVAGALCTVVCCQVLPAALGSMPPSGVATLRSSSCYTHDEVRDTDVILERLQRIAADDDGQRHTAWAPVTATRTMLDRLVDGEAVAATEAATAVARMCSTTDQWVPLFVETVARYGQAPHPSHWYADMHRGIDTGNVFTSLPAGRRPGIEPVPDQSGRDTTRR